MNRAEHLDWCKERALEYVEAGDLANAMASMVSDLGKHEDTAALVHNTVLMQLGMRAVVQGDEHGVRRWIEGFN